MPSEDLEKFRILESRKNYESVDQWLRNFREATWDEFRSVVGSYTPPGAEMSALLADSRKWEDDGLAPHQVRFKNGHWLEDDLRLAVAHYRKSLDYLSLTGSFVRPSGYTEAIPWSILGVDYFLSPFDEKGVSGGFLTVTGLPRVGKTGIGCHYIVFFLRKYREKGEEVLTNIPLEKAVPRVRPVSLMPSLLHGIADALVAKRRWLWAFDEPSLSGWIKRDAATGRAGNLERFARIVPKLGGSFIYIEQREKGVPSAIQDFAQSHIFCNAPGLVYADLPAKRMPIHHVPKPEVRYRTGEAGFFEVGEDFPWEGLFRALRYNPEIQAIEQVDGATQGERILSFLDRLKTSDAEKAKAKARPVVSCRHCGASWQPRSDEPPIRCPRCMKPDPLGVRTPPQPAPSAAGSTAGAPR